MVKTLANSTWLNSWIAAEITQAASRSSLRHSVSFAGSSGAWEHGTWRTVLGFSFRACVPPAPAETSHFVSLQLPPWVGDPVMPPQSRCLLMEKEMATHSSTLAWIFPQTEEPGRPQSMGSQSDATEQLYFTYQYFRKWKKKCTELDFFFQKCLTLLNLSFFPFRAFKLATPNFLKNNLSNIA